MRKALNQWCLPQDWTWERSFELAAEAGFDAIELSIDHPPFFEAIRTSANEGLIGDIARSVGSTFRAGKAIRFDTPDEEVVAVADLARSHGLAISSVLTIAQFHYSLIDADPATRATGIDLVRRLLDIAAMVGAPNILVIPGVVTSRIPYDVAYERLRDALAELLPHATERGVGMGIEDVWGKFLYSPLEMRSLVASFDSPFVGVHFDIGNVMQYGYPDQWIRILGPHLLTVHAKDFLSEVGNIRGFTHLFQGDVPWHEVMVALREAAYDGYLVAEVPPYRFAPEEGIRDIGRKLDILLGLA
ncbi:MAG: sugar phosphate isomerase/epimerase [Chloroflexi bacterium]|nr:sugar phosphate isomerase/epimerase [Chloroflexota bacterium]